MFAYVIGKRHASCPDVERACSMKNNRIVYILSLICVAVTSVKVSALTPSSANRPVSTTQPTSTDLLTEIRLLRQQMQEQERRHQVEMELLQAQIDKLKTNGATDALSSQTSATPTTQEAGSAEDELAGLIGGAAAPSSSGQASAPSSPMSLQGAVQSFNPDISINGDFLAAYSNREGGELDDEFLFREAEVGFSGAIDPYTKGDLIVTVGREDNEFKADLEEAYITYLGLPYNLQMRFGEFRADFGKTNSVHRHAIPWVDYPYVIKRFFGDEGLSGTGAEVSWLVPNPWNKYIALVYEVINNDNDTLFAGQQSDDFTHLIHLKTFNDLSPTSTLELGASFGTAPNTSGHGSNRSMIEGVDMTYRWKPKEAGLYRAFLWQTELLAAQADIIGGQESTWGMYSAAEYQFARRWKFGVRYDNTQLPFSSSLHERGYSAYLTFLQSEFLFWRLGYLITDRNFPVDGNKDEQQLFLQLNWTLGAHPAHKY